MRNGPDVLLPERSRGEACGLMRVVVVHRYPSGPRCWIAGQRIHHGASGLLACVALLARRHPRLAALALLAAAHDRHDWRVWFTREKMPASTLDTSTGAL